MDLHEAAVSLGTRGGKKGGPARAAALTAEERSAIARHAAQTRWGNRPMGQSAARAVVLGELHAVAAGLDEGDRFFWRDASEGFTVDERDLLDQALRWALRNLEKLAVQMEKSDS